MQILAQRFKDTLNFFTNQNAKKFLHRPIIEVACGEKRFPAIYSFFEHFSYIDTDYIRFSHAATFDISKNLLCYNKYSSWSWLNVLQFDFMVLRIILNSRSRGLCICGVGIVLKQSYFYDVTFLGPPVYRLFRNFEVFNFEEKYWPAGSHKNKEIIYTTSIWHLV